MAQAAQAGDTVKVHYTGKLQDGTVFDSSEGRDPLEFTIGSGSLIEGFEQAVVGMTPGDAKTVQLSSAEAYGPRHEEMVQEIERAAIPSEIDLDVGVRLQASQDDGPPVLLTVVEMSESTVTVDANHPLAGEDLTFEIDLVEIA